MNFNILTLRFKSFEPGVMLEHAVVGGPLLKATLLVTASHVSVTDLIIMLSERGEINGHLM